MLANPVSELGTILFCGIQVMRKEKRAAQENA
jgi:hypothetical protein